MLRVTDADELRRRLMRAGLADVRSDGTTRALYSSDASLYRVPPLLMAAPRDADEVAAVLGLCRAEGVPVTARGAGTSIAGNAVGPGVVLDLGRHMDRVLAVDPDAATATVQAGPVTIDRERHEVSLHGVRQALTKTEFQILATLAARQGEAVSREELMLEIWGTAVIGRSRSLDFFMGQIRAKLAGLPLQTVRGFGFRLDS